MVAATQHPFLMPSPLSRMGCAFLHLFWALLILTSGFNHVFGQSNGGLIHGSAVVDGRFPIASTDDDFVCATLDWWPPEKCDYGTCSWGHASLLNLNLSNPILFNAIKAFSPIKLRLGGSLQDRVIYDIGDPGQKCTSFVKNVSEMFGFTQGCLPMGRWDELSNFFKNAGAKIIFGLNALNGRVILPDTSTRGSWNYTNAAALIRYTVNKGYTIYAWELGNELSGNGIGASVRADQYAADVNSLYTIVEDIYQGFSVKPLVLAPGGFFDANWYTELINKVNPNSLDAVTHHIYNLGPGVDEHLVDKILNPAYLDGEASTFSNLQGILKNAGRKTTAWVGEAGGAYNSGHALVTNAFVFSFCQMAVAILDRTHSSDFHASRISEGKCTARRRVFVQTETGCVLDIELDRGDNAHTVKRKLSLVLNVPTEESSLTFGDLVLKNDLSAVRNDSPLLLTRNSLHRSSSTPCLSPTAKDLNRIDNRRDRSGLLEVLGCSTRCARTKHLIKDVVKAIKSGVDPVPVHSGLGGAYYFRNSKGESVAIVKPTDEEPFAPNNPKGFIGKALGQPGLKRSVRVGETGFREVAAYLLDYDNFANVPPTVLVKITHSVFHINDGICSSNSKVRERKPEPISKIASFQQFIPHDFDASDHGTSSFPVAAVHRIGILDVRIFNTDRHAGNLLVRKLECAVGRFGSHVELIPIDHGLCLPESLEDPYFEWIHWPQASIPFSDDELEYIAKLDPVKDSEMLRMELPMIREACLRVLVLCTIFLKEAAAFGLCLAEIGEMMSREFTGGEEEPSELEVLCIGARRLVAEREMHILSPQTEPGDEDETLFDLDYEECAIPRTPPAYHLGPNGVNIRNPFSKLESLDEEEEDGESEENSIEELDPLFSRTHDLLPNVPKLSMSLNGVSITEKTPRYQGVVPKGNNNNNSGVNQNRSANEQLPASASFVKLADMGEDEWGAFLDKFLELLQGAFRDRKLGPAGQKQRQRLGTSCQF